MRVQLSTFHFPLATYHKHMWSRWLTQRDTWTFLLIALLIRGALFDIMLHEHGLHSAWYGWGAETGDTPGYFEPIDSFLAGEAYRPDYRMPGYGLPYLLLRLFTTPQGAGSAIIIAQWLLGVVSVVVLARCARLLGAARWAQYATCIAFAAFPRVAVYDAYWFTESFCTSAIIIGTHGWLAYQRMGSHIALAWAGSWLAWAVFLRPVQLTWLALLGLGLLLLTRVSWRDRFVALGVFLLPFLLVDGWWIRRNAVMHDTFAPLSRGVIMPELASSPMHPLMRFLQATGGNYIHWDPSAHIRWFNMREGPLGRQGPRIDQGVEMPAFALCERITEDSLRAWADDMLTWSDGHTTGEERMALFRKMNARSDRFVQYYKDDRPWQYHACARWRLTRLFFGRAGSGPLAHTPPRYATWSAGPIAALDVVMHWVILLGGLVSAVIALLRWRSGPTIAWIGGITLISVFLIPWALRLCEGRYLVPMYPWLLLLLILGFSRFAVARSRVAAS